MKPTPEYVYGLYCKGRKFNDDIRLDETVKANENMFIGKQWEGVVANGLPTTQLNFLKRTIMFKVATICSDSIKVQATALEKEDALKNASNIITNEFDGLMERNGIVRLMRRFTRDAAVRGDGCIYTYWDDTAESGAKRGNTKIKGDIVSEVLQNTRVYFGNPNDNRVERQPWILIRSMTPVEELRKRVSKDEADLIQEDEDDRAMNHQLKNNGLTTSFLLLWKEDEEVWAYECTKNVIIKDRYSLGIKRYPIVWLNWDYIQDSYHGQAEATGIIPNQMAYNKIWAASVLSIMQNAFPKIVYDPTRIKKWTNQIGSAIQAPGGDVSNVAKVIESAPMSPQVFQFMAGFVEQTESAMGVTKVALGDTRPDNTSAIVALQRAASTPMELTKLDLYDAIEDLFRIYLEFITAYYGKRTVWIDVPEELDPAFDAAAQSDPTIKKPESIPVEYDFKELKTHIMRLKLDAGASSYFSEISALQTLDNMLKMGVIDGVQYLERIPEGYIKDKGGLLKELKANKAMILKSQLNSANSAETEEEEVEGGKGYKTLQRKINDGERV